MKRTFSSSSSQPHLQQHVRPHLSSHAHEQAQRQTSEKLHSSPSMSSASSSASTSSSSSTTRQSAGSPVESPTAIIPTTAPSAVISPTLGPAQGPELQPAPGPAWKQRSPPHDGSAEATSGFPSDLLFDNGCFAFRRFAPTSPQLPDMLSSSEQSASMASAATSATNVSPLSVQINNNGIVPSFQRCGGTNHPSIGTNAYHANPNAYSYNGNTSSNTSNNTSSNSNNNDHGDPASGCLAGPTSILSNIFQPNKTKSKSNQKSANKSAMLDASASAAVAGAIADVTDIKTKGETPEFLIANEMKQLSLNERDIAYEEIHGVAPEQPEDMEFIKLSCAKLDKEIKKITTTSTRHAYDRCAFLNPKYVRSTAFRMLFLRSEQHDAPRAAKRIMDHFTKKLELFGYDFLARDICWDDLSDDEAECIRTSGASFLPTARDRTGRSIFLLLYGIPDNNKSVECHSRSIWYTIMSCMQLDAETQRKGMVGVLYSHNASVNQFLSVFAAQQHTLWVNTCLPFRVTGMHYCMEDDRLRRFFSLVTVIASKEMRTRTRLHYGSNTEVQYALNTFGIPNEALRIDGNGYAQSEWMDRKMQDLRKKEKVKVDHQKMIYEQDMYHHDVDGKGNAVKLVKIYHPVANDVLLGRGRPYQYHPGNHVMMDMVEEQKPDHVQGSRFVKKHITEQIVNHIRSKGGRFLRRIEKPSPHGPETDAAAANRNTADNNSDSLRNQDPCVWELDRIHDKAFHPYWIQVPDSKAHEKVAMAFRNLTRRDKDALVTET